jgi:hypothetical protein
MSAAICFGIDLGSAARDTTVVTHYDGTTGQWREVARTPHPADEGIAACIGCGCTDDRACLGGCWWLDVDRAAGKGVCCYCEDHLQAFHAQQAAARLDEQEAQARQRVRDYIDCAAEWALMSHRVQTRDTRDRMDEALARHRRTAKAILHRLTPGASSDPAPRIVDIASLADFAGHLYPLTDWQRQNLNSWEASQADRRARPRGARP